MRLAAGVLALLVAAGAASAAELAGADLPDAVMLGDKLHVLNGLGLREATILMVDVYVAGLYVEKKTTDPAAILAPTASKKLIMKFVRNVGKEKLVEAWTDGFKKNAKDKAAAVAPGLAQLNAAMTDVKKGDEIALRFIPKLGTTVSVKDRDVVTIDGDDFASVLFSIWLGPNPPNAGLREGLLGRNKR
ncbi:MAG TPA: chalcone isomerase family protein [Candidatus Polarisedimenticolaceae bacterium]|nr:chalcone isomerase family protein [Candidatus Polarisedimenticolaceae bacterium]